MVDILPPDPARVVPLLSAMADGVEPQAPPPEPAPVPVPVDSSGGIPDETAALADEPAADDAGAGEVPPPKPRQPFGERLGDMARQRREAEERADRLAKIAEDALAAVDRLTKAREPQPEPPPPPPARPTRDAFDSPDAYDSALIEWSAGEATRRAVAEFDRRQAETLAQQEQQRQQQAQEQAQQSVVQQWQEKRAKSLERHADYAEVAEREDVIVSDAMRDAILQSDEGTEIAYHLGLHPEEAERIRQLPPLRQIVEIGKLAAAVSAPPRAQPSRAPAPITPVGNNSAATERVPNEMSTEEWAARRMPQVRAERRAGMYGIPRDGR